MDFASLLRDWLGGGSEITSNSIGVTIESVSCLEHVFLLGTKNDILGGGFKHFLFSPLPGEMIQFD